MPALLSTVRAAVFAQPTDNIITNPYEAAPVGNGTIANGIKELSFVAVNVGHGAARRLMSSCSAAVTPMVCGSLTRRVGGNPMPRLPRWPQRDHAATGRGRQLRSPGCAAGLQGDERRDADALGAAIQRPAPAASGCPACGAPRVPERLGPPMTRAGGQGRAGWRRETNQVELKPQGVMSRVARLQSPGSHRQKQIS